MAKRRKRDDKKGEQFFADERLKFTGLVRHALLVSNKIGRQIATPPAGYASWLFVRACITAKSIERLFELQEFTYGVRYLDHASIASLCRDLIENIAVVRYLGDVLVSDDEWKCRRYVIDIHDYKNRDTFLTLIGQPQSDEKRFALLEKHLLDNAFFQTLAVQRQRRLLNGDDMFIHGRHAAMLVFGWGDEMTRGIYKYLSHQTHSQSMAFQRTEQNRLYEEHSPYAKVVAGFATSFARMALGFGCMHMVSLFPYIEAAFDPHVFAALKAEYGADE